MPRCKPPKAHLQSASWGGRFMARFTRLPHRSLPNAGGQGEAAGGKSAASYVISLGGFKLRCRLLAGTRRQTCSWEVRQAKQCSAGHPPLPVMLSVVVHLSMHGVVHRHVAGRRIGEE